MNGLYGMRYPGELTKLRAYDFQFWFQVLSVADDGARDDRMAHTID